LLKGRSIRKIVELARRAFELSQLTTLVSCHFELKSYLQLGLSFDYINCDEVLYFFPDPSVENTSYKSVLQLNGIIVQIFCFWTFLLLPRSGSLSMGLMDDRRPKMELVGELCEKSE